MANWLDLVEQTALQSLPKSAWKQTDNGVSIVYVASDKFIYKRSIPYLIENEYAFLFALADTDFVPSAFRYDKYTLKIENLWGSMPITDPFVFVNSCKLFLQMLAHRGIRHGDLTKPHVIVRNNRIKVIDWAESRWGCDHAPDKRSEGDEYWMDKTMEVLLDDKRHF